MDRGRREEGHKDDKDDKIGNENYPEEAIRPGFNDLPKILQYAQSPAFYIFNYIQFCRGTTVTNNFKQI